MSSELVDRAWSQHSGRSDESQGDSLSAQELLDEEAMLERRSRVVAHLAELRAPLAGLELNNDDHAVLTRLADHDIETVFTLSSLLRRARSAPPLPDRAE
jgi:hypothetical protein